MAMGATGDSRHAADGKRNGTESPCDCRPRPLAPARATPTSPAGGEDRMGGPRGMLPQQRCSEGTQRQELSAPESSCTRLHLAKMTIHQDLGSTEPGPPTPLQKGGEGTHRH